MFFNDEKGQGAAEYILLFGAMIVLAIAAIIIYNNYVKSTTPFDSSSDLNNVRTTSALK
ncbi:MAG: class III signal peptide-containing protein [Methanobacteriaceae archaeon]|nr:class III signal peptide-containing protein [Methanobacteriaceae archaeon]